MRVVLLENIHPKAQELFEKAGHQVTTIPRALTPKELGEVDADVVGIRSQTQFRDEAFSKPRLVVGAYCIGTNQIDLPACDLHGCIAFNDPFSNSRSVAELVVGNLIMLFRGLLGKCVAMHSGTWDKSANGSQEIRGKTLGIIGYGNIGQQVGHLAEDLGMDVLYHDVEEKASHGKARKCNTAEELFAVADAVTFHVDGRDRNRNMFGPEQIARMKQGAYIINCSRGMVVDEEALAQAIRDRRLGGVALDVHQSEPGHNAEVFKSPLQGLQNVLLTPHIGGSTQEAQAAIAVSTTNRILDFLRYGTIQLSPNFPKRSYTDQPVNSSRRITYWHRNVRGQIHDATAVISDHGGNIDGQHLITNERVGYATFDVHKAQNLLEIHSQLEALEGAIRVRIL